MTQDESWQNKYQKEIALIETNKRNRSISIGMLRVAVW